MKRVRLANRTIGDGQPAFVIAEAGINHNGNVDLAMGLVDAAGEAGADAVKFQTFKAEELVSKSSLRAKHVEGEASLFEMVKKLELRREDFKKLAEYARKRDIVFLSTPLGEESVDVLYDLGVPAYKVASGDITDIPLLEYIARKRLPVILSTGMSTLGEIEEALTAIYSNGNEDVMLLHCVASYPTPLEEVNLRAMDTLRQAFQVPVGFSDHTTSTIVPVAAVAWGATIIEKHFTLDKNLPGPDHKASANPEELKLIVQGIREAEMISGSPVKGPTKSEEGTKPAFRRSIVAKVNIAKGTKITREMLATKRPGTGVPPKFIDLVVDRSAAKNIGSDQVISWEDI